MTPHTIGAKGINVCCHKVVINFTVASFAFLRFKLRDIIAVARFTCKIRTIGHRLVTGKRKTRHLVREGLHVQHSCGCVRTLVFCVAPKTANRVDDQLAMQPCFGGELVCNFGVALQTFVGHIEFFPRCSMA